MAAIELEGVTKDYGEVLANDDVTFTVERGEIFGYLGPNGAGKTTTIRTLLGFLSPTEGSGRLLGHDITDEDDLIEAKRRLGYLPDDPAFDETATGREILELHASIKGDERSAELLELFDPPLDRTVREYSHGNVRKLGLVTTFMHDPDLVILDEPTSGLDPLMQQRFAEFVRSERDQGMTVFFSSHVLSEVRRLCDRVGIIRDGRLVTVEPVESLLDRSGKVVRLRAAEPIPTEALEIDGVHELETSLDPGEGESERDATTPATAFTECTLTFTGDVNALLDRLREYRLLDLSIEEAPLEDVFMRFYGGERSERKPTPAAKSVPSEASDDV
ncbi:ATP-binding cassette domain-containing protein [Natronorubrum sp. JWXQ-INN-674]|uniref:ATP-binding cassette domain-containing protein n=1 Tax=Natronorubrum halalkaliphilum TaxID=2691917 RepID=A0A6B0VPC5_9EURY|nr:ABC transporter ATP-binding protein [Natronorubrum halalkaliphilum]MXV63105.1 ATP-binding cassette domain-containing protein [Natronorubrum halalkaliphilum]